MIRKQKFSKRKLKKFKKMYDRFKAKLRFRGRRIRKLRGYRLRTLKFLMKLRGPEGNARNVGEDRILKRTRKEKKKLKIRYLSKKITLSLFKVTYDTLLNYHSPLGRLKGEWKVGLMLTNILLIKNRMSMLDLTNVFFELKKMVNRIFKALKLRKGIALLNGRRYGWRKVFTFIFEKWLPGFFTNFDLNILEMVGYFIKKKFLTRRQLARSLSLKVMSLEKNYLSSFRRGDEIRMKRDSKMINFMKLPSVSLSLVDNLYWLRECQKEGISAIQVIDSNSDIEKVDYPIISNQQSIAFLSFISLLSKEIVYQARFWEITRMKKFTNYYNINERIKKDNLVEDVAEDLDRWNDKVFRYNKYLSLGYKLSKRFPKKSREKIMIRKYLIFTEVLENYKYRKIDKKINRLTHGFLDRRYKLRKLLTKI